MGFRAMGRAEGEEGATEGSVYKVGRWKGSYDGVVFHPRTLTREEHIVSVYGASV